MGCKLCHRGPGHTTLQLCHHSATGFACLAASRRVRISFHCTNCLERSRVWTRHLRKVMWKLRGINPCQSILTAPLQSLFLGRGPGHQAVEGLHGFNPPSGRATAQHHRPTGVHEALVNTTHQRQARASYTASLPTGFGMCLGTGIPHSQDRDTGHHIRKVVKPRVGDPTESAQGEGVSSAVPGLKFKGYHFVVILKECLDTVSEIVTLLLQRGQPQCMRNK